MADASTLRFLHYVTLSRAQIGKAMWAELTRSTCYSRILSYVPSPRPPAVAGASWNG